MFVSVVLDPGGIDSAKAIAEILGGDVTKGKVVSRVKVLIEEGFAVKEKTEDKKVAYKLA